MRQVRMTLSYQIGGETKALSKALELYDQWKVRSDSEDELVITIHPGLM